jgi:hypothetical protein
MQRKVFEIDGQPHLATRDGSFFETAGTLERLIAGELEARSRADLAAWEAGGTAEPSPAPAPAQAAPEPAERRDKLETPRRHCGRSWSGGRPSWASPRRCVFHGGAAGAAEQRAAKSGDECAQAARRHRHQARGQIPRSERRGWSGRGRTPQVWRRWRRRAEGAKNSSSNVRRQEAGRPPTPARGHRSSRAAIQSRYFRTLDQVDQMSRASPDHGNDGNSRAIAPLGSPEGSGAHPRSD